ncbi:MAG TPA: ribonuclease J [Candidatus Deferrimicrobiaceae bacterium]|jgi:ribonuclease J
MTLRVVPLGGLGEIGMNAMLFDDGATALLVDAGLMFPDETMLGIDYVIPDFAILADVAPRLAGVLLTHGHEDHIGAVPFLLKEYDVPVFGTRLTLGLVGHRLAEYGLDKARLEVVPRAGRFRVGSFEIESFPVCHSIPDAVGYILRCQEGIFVHTGDFKIDDTPPDGIPTAIDRLARLGREEGVTALFSDSTNVEREGHGLSEAFVGEALSEIFAAASGRVIVAMFSSNIHRVQQVLNAAWRNGRKVALSGRSMVRNVNTAQELGYMKLPHPEVLTSMDRLSELPDNRVVVLTTGSQGEPRSALTLMALGEHKYIKVKPGDTAVLSSKFIPGNERTIFNVINHLFLAGADVLYDSISEVHVSGHATRDDLVRMIEAVRPVHFVPVHGEARLLIRHLRLAQSLGVPIVELALNGQILEFTDGMLSRAGELEVNRLFVDGKGVGDVDGFVLKDRFQISQVGLVMVLMAISTTTGEILYGPDVMTRGVVTEHDDEELVAGAREAVLACWEAAGPETRKDYAEFKDEVRRAVRRFFNKRLDRKPVILPVIVGL